MIKSAAFEVGVITAFILQKESGFLGRILKKKPAAPLKMSFKGHGDAIRKATGPAHTNVKGVVTKRKFDPMTQKIQQQRYATL